MPQYRVILLPGSVLPAELAYGGLLSALGSNVDALAKELEVYAASEPPLDDTLDVEVDGVLRESAALGWDRFHLVGYSGGGASALGFGARSDFRLEVFDKRHHFDPPHRIEPERLADSLIAPWKRAEESILADAQA